MREVFDIVDDADAVIGRASRGEVHGNPALIHRVAHVLVFNRHGELYLQRRAMNKDVQPGKWDTSVGGHVDCGETYDAAAVRELEEELGIGGANPALLWKYLHRNEYESEYVCTYRIQYDGEIRYDSHEIIEGRFWKIIEIRDHLESGVFTPNFVDEFRRLIKKRPPDEEKERST